MVYAVRAFFAENLWHSPTSFYCSASGTCWVVFGLVFLVNSLHTRVEEVASQLDQPSQFHQKEKCLLSVSGNTWAFGQELKDLRSLASFCGSHGMWAVELAGTLLYVQLGHLEDSVWVYQVWTVGVIFD